MTCDEYGFAEFALYLRQEGVEGTEPERSRMTRHVKECVDCQIKLDDVRTILEGFPQGISPLRPPSSLREKTLAAAFAARSPAEVKAQPEGAKRHTRGLFARDLFGRLLTISAQRWLVVSTLALLFVSGTLSVKVALDHSQLTELQAKLAQQKVAAYELKPTSLARQAVGKAIVEQNGGELHVYVVISHTLPTQGNQVYHVWLWRNGSRISAGMFHVDRSGQAVFQGSLTGAWAGLNGIGITLEPNANTTTPVGPKVFGAQL
ncbi:MAG: hypothetical protein A2201_03035 [Alicyclobacillus sp. RIFOXYA1_FULL_53_8]|nr:MAG: hypothetical protein A2201_03035 [Alicyclobacillus sp. RIFOXYA1_FULL_53_8]